MPHDTLTSRRSVSFLCPPLTQSDSFKDVLMFGDVEKGSTEEGCLMFIKENLELFDCHPRVRNILHRLD